MKRTKKIISLALVVLMLVSCVPVTTFTAFAAQETGVQTSAVQSSLSENLPEIPNGYHYTDRTYEDEFGSKFYYIEGEASEYGLIDGYWIDDAGEKLAWEDTPLVEFEPSAKSNEQLPAKYDARDDGLITPVEYQIGGTCWAHAAMACMEANAIKKGFATKDTINLSEYYLAWHGRNSYYSGVTDAANDGVICTDFDSILNGGGNYTYSNDTSLNFSGPVFESKYKFATDNGNPYGSSSEKSTALLNEMKARFVNFSEKQDFDYVLKSTKLVSNTRADIKNALLKYGAVEMYYYSDNDYYTARWNAGNAICAYYYPSDMSTNHAVTIVGWDDNFSVDNFTAAGGKPEKNGAWLVKNSWSNLWGNDGYFWLSYEDRTMTQLIVYDVEKKDDYKNVYLYDGRGNYSSISATASANVFTAKGAEYLSKVGDGSTGINKYTFSIYKLSDSYASPTDGTKVYTQSGDNKGERYIDVEGAVKLAAGDKFSVVFENITAARTETTSSSSTTVYQSQPKQSYYMKNGEWIDSNSAGRNNTCVRAITKDITSGPYKVKFTCPGYFEETRTTTNGTVALPVADGYTWSFTSAGEPFDGNNITTDRVVISHCYPTDGTVKAGEPCTKEYKCIYCDEEIKPAVTTHSYSADKTVAPTPTCPGYKVQTCSVCGETYIHDYAFYSNAVGGVADNFAWQISNGVLSILGKGDLPDYDTDTDAPWYSYKDEVQSVVINGEITKIGKNSFKGYSNIKNITFCDTIKEIGDYAFSEAAIETFTAPESLEKIGSYAFSNTKSLNTIAFNDKISYIGANAFTYCAITQAVMPASLTSYGSPVFQNCSKIEKYIIEDGVKSISSSPFFINRFSGNAELVIPASVGYISYWFYLTKLSNVSKVTVDENNKNYASKDGIMFSKDMKTLYWYPASKNEMYYHVLEDVTSLGVGAFADAYNLKYLDMSDCKVTELTDYSIWNISSLRNINLPTGITSIGSHALTYIYFVEKIYIPSSVTSIASDNFSSHKTDFTIYTDTATSAAKTFADTKGINCVVLSHSHSYDTNLYSKSADCISDGVNVKGCQCGNFSYTVTTKTGVHGKDNPVVTNPTCTEQGYTTYTCAVCGEVYKADYTNALEHNFEWVIDKQENCGENGTKHEKCTRCDATRNNGTVIPATGNHSYEWITDKAPTCGETGIKHEQCSVCGAKRNENTVISATGNHSYGWITDKVPTCGETGIKHEQCSVCHAKRSENTVIPATGNHSFTVKTVSADSLKSAATCQSNAVYYYTCAVCGRIEKNDAHTFEAENTKLAHTVSEWITDKQPTCKEFGSKHKECTVCHKTLETQQIAKLAHTQVTVPGKAATCSETGLTEGIVCSVCGEVIKAQTVIEKTAHNSSDWITDKQPTCKEFGSKHKECTVCHETLETQQIAKFAHTQVTVLGKAATCSETGLTDGIVCSVCGEVIKAQTVIAKTAHNSSEWIIDKQPTCKEYGSKHKECTVCHETLETQQIAKLEHTQVTVLGKAATCSETGLTDGIVCSVCGEVIKAQTVIEKIPHTFDDGVVTKNPTCTESGEKLFTCTVCGASELRTVEKLGHSYGEWVIIKEPTCSEEGLKERVCTNDGSHVETVTIAKTAHNDSDGDGYCDDCGNDMQSSDRCKYCGKIHTGPFAWLVKLFHSIFALFKRK